MAAKKRKGSKPKARKRAKPAAKNSKTRRRKKEEEDMEKGQMWSVDVIIGIVIFVSIITVFYTTLSGSTDDVRIVLKTNADTVINKFTSDPALKVIEDGNVLNNSKLQTLAMMDYETLKRQLGIQGDFCIFIEDENGRIVPIGGKNSIGKGDINISNQPCGT